MEGSIVSGVCEPRADRVVLFSLVISDRVEVVVRDVPGVMWETAEQQRRAAWAAHGLRRHMVLEEGAGVAEAGSEVGHVREPVVLPVVIEVIGHNPNDVVLVRSDGRLREKEHHCECALRMILRRECRPLRALECAPLLCRQLSADDTERRERGAGLTVNSHCCLGII